MLLLIQEEEPNDRKISKLCEYASKNPLRVPKACEFLKWNGSFILLIIFSDFPDFLLPVFVK